MERKKIVGDSVDLYQLEDRHIKPYLELFSPTIQELLHVKDPQSEEHYLRERIAQNEVYFFVIGDKETGLVIGSIEIRKPTFRSQLYCWLHESYWGTGRFDEAMCLAAESYFAETNASSISARVDIDNKRSFHALQKIGFVEIGRAAGPYGLQFEMLLLACALKQKKEQ